MNNFHYEEGVCSHTFHELGRCFHLWTSERCEVIFQTVEDFRAGMNIIGICAKFYPELRILGFEIMSNHLHFAIAGDEATILSFIETLKKFLARYFKKAGRTIDWSGFCGKTRELTTLEDIRNVIVYINRNGYVVSSEHTPFTYPWGSNRYYFSPDSVAYASILSRHMTLRERQAAVRSRSADHIKDLEVFDGYALPLSFCGIASGERLFRNPSHYFHKLGRSIENQKKIAQEISESIFYTDDELFSAISSLAKDKFGCHSLSHAPAAAKLELSKVMRYEYNASSKQIQRILKISSATLMSLLGGQ